MAHTGQGRWDDGITEDARNHPHPGSRLCHTIGIPMNAVSRFVFAVGLVVPRLWLFAGLLFFVGWIFQFVGHAYEHKPPEFLKDWRFLFVGLRWWMAKLRGRA